MATIINKNDSMTKIQEKLNKGGDITFTNATYKITKQLVISANSKINLNGSILQRKGNLQSIFINKVTKNTTKYNGAGNITITNGTFEGMGGYSYDNLLTFFHSHDINIENCTFKDILCHGIEINSSQNVTIYKCKFLGYNLQNKENAFRECIQLDHAGYSGLVISGSSSSSKCYDGTCCDNIEVCHCIFSKSAYRDYPYACIGEHSQLRGNYKHDHIRIHHNEFYCKKNPELKQACLSFTSMNNVTVTSNIFDCYKVARIYSKATSYKLNGTSVTAGDGDGICSNISITDNTISGCKNNTEAFQQYNKSGTTNHSKITKKKNTFI